MDNLYLENLKDNRNEILKAEMVSLFALLEKTFTEWWKGKGYFKDYSPIYTDIEKEIENQLLSNFKSINIGLKIKHNSQIIDNINVWNDFINNNWRRWRKIKLKDNPEKFLQVLFGGCEGINSGIEKGAPREQIKGDMPFLTSPYGSFKNFIDNHKLNKLRKILFKDNIKTKLNELSQVLQINVKILKRQEKYFQYSINQLIKDLQLSSFWKLIATRIRIYNIICFFYSYIPSDSRLPANDTSLFDQNYMSTSLFKAYLSNIILKNRHEIDITNFDQSKIKWSILGIQYDKLSLAEKGLKAGSIKWYRETSKKVDDAIKKLLEIDYPIGNEVYRDETGIYFAVGEDLKGNKVGDFYTLHPDLGEIKERIQEVFTNNFEAEIYPAIFLTEPSRGIMNLGHLVEKAKENFLKAEIPDNFEEKLERQYDSNPQRVCQICRLRLANKQNKDDLICDVCKNRLQGRIDNWLQNLEDETIWTDELQDKNGRIALVTLKFELDRWINGDMVNSLVVQNFDLNSKKCDDYLNSIIDGIKNNKKLNNTFIKDYHTNIPNLSLKQLTEKWFLERSIGSKWEEFIKSKLGNKIDFENRQIHWQALTDSDIQFLAELILQFLLRKNPSPARLKRMWDTTREFFEELSNNIVNLAGIKENRQKRLVWDGVAIKDGEYYDGDILFWAKGKSVYLISSVEKISGKDEFKLKEDGSDDNSIVATLKTENATEQLYKPYFSIMDPTPISWQFIIPAENVPVLIKNIQEEYFKYFRYVYGKLPLHIGIIIQDYKKPLYVGIKALRKIRRDKQKWNNLRIELSAKAFKARQKKAFHYQQMPEKISDRENFYSLFEKVDGEGRYEFYLYEEDKNHIKKAWLDITQNASDTEKFYFYQNTFDFEFLDTNARRNDIFYKNAKRVMKLKQNRPYDIENWQYFANFKNFFKERTSKLQKLVSLIYSKLEDWQGNDSSFQKFILSSFVNILELKDNKDELAQILGLTSFEDLKNMDKKEFKEKMWMFLDMFEFWHTALKEV